jgi:hypothetical protein
VAKPPPHPGRPAAFLKALPYRFRLFRFRGLADVEGQQPRPFPLGQQNGVVQHGHIFFSPPRRHQNIGKEALIPAGGQSILPPLPVGGPGTSSSGVNMVRKRSPNGP